MKHTLRSKFLLVLLASCGVASAQNPCDSLVLQAVDLNMRPGLNSDLEIRVRPDHDISNAVFSGLVFTIHWDAASNVHLGTVTNPPPANFYMPVNKSAPEQDNNGMRYQIFSGSSINNFSDIPFAWIAGQEYLVATVPVVGGQTTFSIMNDSWTAANNSDFFVSVNGCGIPGYLTGSMIYDFSTGVTAGSPLMHDLSVEPNPAQESAMITAHVTGGTQVDLTLVSAAGQEVWKRTIASSTGTLREPLDLSHVDQGVYMLRMRSADGVATRRVVKR